MAQVVMGLAQGFAEAKIPDLERTWVVTSHSQEWLAPLLPHGDHVIVIDSFIESVGASVAHVAPNFVSRARPYVERLRSVAVLASTGVTALDRELRRRGVHVAHVPFQEGMVTDLPTIYHPHDLQHIHLPQFFSKAQLQRREIAWRAQAEQAYAVSAGTEAVAADVNRYWQIPRDRVFVVPLAPVNAPASAARPNPAATSVAAVGEAEGLVLYPAAFWPHKNHETLVRAAGLLRSAGVAFSLKLPGSPVGDFGRVREAVLEAGLNAQEVLPGYVSESELAVMFAAAAIVVVPSLFESASFPIWEAFARSKPVVAALTTSLPQQVGDGGIIVDPTSPTAFAAAIASLLRDPSLRESMGSRGRAWASQFTWQRTVLASSALYRRAAGHAPRAEEEAALTHGPFI